MFLGFQKKDKILIHDFSSRLIKPDGYPLQRWTVHEHQNQKYARALILLILLAGSYR